MTLSFLCYTEFDMTIFIGADHRGFALKNQLIEYLQEKNIRVEDLGNFRLEPLDDNVDFAQKVAQAVLQKPEEFLGIVICGSGVGTSIAANRNRGIRCSLGFNEAQVKHSRENDHVNMLALPSDYINLDTAKMLLDTFISTQPKMEEKYLRRVRKLDE